METKNNKIKIIEIDAENEYEIGYKLGELFKEYLNKNINIHKERLKNDNIKKAVLKIQEKLKKEYPQYLEEIYGRADGAQVDKLALLLMFCPEIYKAIGGCTTIISNLENERILFAHNEDGVNKTLDMLAIVKVNFKGQWVIGYIFADKLLGSAFAYNSNGMVFSNNYIYGVNSNINNVSRYFMTRDLMFAKDIDDVIEKVNRIEIASAFSLNVLDINNKKAINIEKEHNRTDITEIDKIYVRSNHLLVNPKEEQDIPQTSIFRYKKAKELTEKLEIEKIEMENLVDILQYYTEDYNKCIYKDKQFFKDIKKKSKTCATFTFDTLDNRVIIYEYIGMEKIEINYETFEIKREDLENILKKEKK